MAKTAPGKQLQDQRKKRQSSFLSAFPPSQQKSQSFLWLDYLPVLECVIEDRGYEVPSQSNHTATLEFVSPTQTTWIEFSVMEMAGVGVGWGWMLGCQK